MRATSPIEPTASPAGGFLARVRLALRGTPAVEAPVDEPAPGPPRPTAASRSRARAAEADLLQGEAEADYQRDRLALYTARALSGKDTDPARLRELQRLSAAAAARLSQLRKR